MFILIKILNKKSQYFHKLPQKLHKYPQKIHKTPLIITQNEDYIN